MAQKVTSGLFRDILLDIVREILYFPIWWYTVGLLKTGKFCWNLIRNMELRLGVKVWVVNIFRPMFGQRDIAGVLISFFVRLSQIIFRSIALFFWIILVLILFLIWMGAPILIVLGIVLNLVAM